LEERVELLERTVPLERVLEELLLLERVALLLVVAVPLLLLRRLLFCCCTAPLERVLVEELERVVVPDPLERVLDELELLPLLRRLLLLLLPLCCWVVVLPPLERRD
jgi:hypothetical protein